MSFATWYRAFLDHPYAAAKAWEAALPKRWDIKVYTQADTTTTSSGVTRWYTVKP